MYMRDVISARVLSGQRRCPLRMRQIIGSANELTTEVLRLLVLYPHDASFLDQMGVTREEMAAWLCQTLPRPGGVLMTADDGHRLQGLLHLEALAGPSAAAGMYVWGMGPLIVAPGAPGDTVDAMLNRTLGSLDTPADVITVRVPAADKDAVESLKTAGFEIGSGEVVAVSKTPDFPRDVREEVNLVTLAQEHLPAAVGMACESGLADFKCFDRDQVRKLIRLDLALHIHESGKKGLVALGADGKPTGFATWSLDAETEIGPLRRVGSINQLCVHPGPARRAVATQLGGRVLRELFGQGANAVVARVAVNGSTARLALLRKIGFESIHTNLLMRRRKQPSGSKPVLVTEDNLTKEEKPDESSHHE